MDEGFSNWNGSVGVSAARWLSLLFLAGILGYANRPASLKVLAQTVTEKPQLILQTGHAFKTDAMAFSPDGKWLATGSTDRTVKIWDAATGNELRTLAAGVGVKALMFSPDGKTLAVGGTEGALQWWNVVAGEKRAAVKADNSVVTALVFSTDGRWLVTGGLKDAGLKVWDAATQQKVREIAGLSDWITTLAISSSGDKLVAGNAAGLVKLWQFSDGREQSSITAHQGRIRTLSFSPTGEMFATGGQDGAVRWWNVSDGKLRQQYAARTSPIVSLQFAAQGSQLWACADDHQVARLDLNTGAALAILTEANILNRYESAAFSADAEWLAACDGTRNVSLRALVGNRSTVALDSRVNPVKAVAVSGDERWLALGHQDSTVTLWETTAGQPAATLANNEGRINALAFSPDHQTLAVGSNGGVIQLWNVAELRESQRWTAHKNAGINALAFTPDGKQLISASIDRSLKAWDAETGAPLGQFAGHDRDVSALAISTDGQRLFSAGADGLVIAWDMVTRQPLARYALGKNELLTLTISRNGKWLATGGAQNSVYLLDAATGQISKELRLSETASPFEQLLSLQFSQDEQLVYAGHSDGSLALWEVSSGALRTRANVHVGALNALALARESGWLLTGSEDGSVRLWQAPANSSSPPGSNTANSAMTEAATLLSARGEWLVATPTGFFDGSPQAWRQVLWRINRETAAVAPVEVFFNEYFYPELLATVFGKRPLPQRENISQRDRRQPQVELSVATANASKADPIATRTVSVRLIIREASADAAYAQGSGARDVRLFRNGSLVKIWRGDVLRGSREVTLECPVTLVAGENRLTAYAFNRINVKSPDATQVVTGAESLRRRGTAFVIAAGLNQYSNPAYNLRFAVADAELFCAEWQKQQGVLQQFERVETILLTNEQATKGNLLAALQKLAGGTVANAALPAAVRQLPQAQPEDAVIVYFAGHGVADEPRFYLLPYDLGYRGARASLTAESLRQMLRNGISDQELEQAFEAIDASYFLLALDACNSGQAIEAEDRRRGPMNTRGLAQLAYEKGLNILAASQSNQIAIEDKSLGHGYLTYALIEEGIKKLAADRRPRDRQVWLKEWLDYATQAVPQLQERYVNQRIQTGREIRTRRLTALREVQRPRIFYRREAEAPPLVIARQP